MTKKVAVIVLNWNGISDTLACVESLTRQSYTNFEIFVVDNASSEPSTRVLLDSIKSDSIHIIHNQKNIGFAGGVNTGIRNALLYGFDYVALINNDAVAHPKWLTELVTASKEYASSITTSLVLHSDRKTIDSTGDWYSTWGLPFPRDRDKLTKYASKSGFVFGGSGAGTLYNTEVFQQVGLFDETFFMYYEDVDLSFRAQLHGYKAYFTDKAIIYHKRGASSSSLPDLPIYHTFKNLPLLFAKNTPSRLLFPIGFRFLLAYWLIFGHAIKKKRYTPAVKGLLMSVYLFWFHAVPARIKIQRNRKVSADYIKSILWLDLPPDQTGLRKFRRFFTGK